MSQPAFDTETQEYMFDVIKSGWWSQGKMTELFEKNLSEYFQSDETNIVMCLYNTLGVIPSDKRQKFINNMKSIAGEKGLTINGVKKMLNNTQGHSLDDSINLSVYKPGLKTTKVIKEKVKNI